MGKLLDDTKLEAWRLFITAHARIIEAIDKELDEAEEMPLNWYDILIELYEAEGRRLRLHELAQRVVLSRSSITRLVDQLEDKGYLERQADPEDRRGSYAAITTAGEDALRKAWPHYAAAIERHFGRFLSEEEAALLVTVLGGLEIG
jgi:DNA-binding MarR family transcriptional regulator